MGRIGDLLSLGLWEVVGGKEQESWPGLEAGVETRKGGAGAWEACLLRS